LIGQSLKYNKKSIEEFTFCHDSFLSFLSSQKLYDLKIGFLGKGNCFDNLNTGQEFNIFDQQVQSDFYASFRKLLLSTSDQQRMYKKNN
jgi:hypothetical protein